MLFSLGYKSTDCSFLALWVCTTASIAYKTSYSEEKLGSLIDFPSGPLFSSFFKSLTWLINLRN